MVEENFAFLKDPVFVNSLFLRSPSGIEALGLALVHALMIWRLMGRAMSLNVAARSAKGPGMEEPGDLPANLLPARHKIHWHLRARAPEPRSTSQASFHSPAPMPMTAGHHTGRLSYALGKARAKGSTGKNQQR
jgi:hypothetical protein